MTTAPYQVMPPLSADEYAALKADIGERGVQVPVEYDEQGAILDGHHRIQICEELGLTNWPRLIRYGLSEPEKRRHARRLNINRRHLNSEQKREQIEAELREAPDTSDRAIATGLGVDHKTVGAVRGDLESTGEIPQLEERKGRDQRVRRIVQYVDPSPEGIRGTKLTAKSLHHTERQVYRDGARDLARTLSDASALKPTGRRFPVIYADPPWRRRAGFTDRSYENHFPTMPWDKIAEMPVANRSLPNAWLFMWMPRAHILASTTMVIKVDKAEITIPTTLAQRISTAWGYEHYSTCFVWTKTDAEHEDNIGNGLIVRDQDEVLLLFKRGRGLPMPDTPEKFGSNHREMPTEHSRKPEFYRQMIKTMTGDLPVLELFARVDAEHPLPANWYSAGNESDHSADVAEPAPQTADGESYDSETGELKGDAQWPDDRDIGTEASPLVDGGGSAEPPSGDTGGGAEDPEETPGEGRQERNGGGEALDREADQGEGGSYFGIKVAPAAPMKSDDEYVGEIPAFLRKDHPGAVL